MIGHCMLLTFILRHCLLNKTVCWHMWRIPMVGNVCCDTVASRGTWGACGQLPSREHHNCATWPWLGLPCTRMHERVSGTFPPDGLGTSHALYAYVRRRAYVLLKKSEFVHVLDSVAT